MLSSLLLSKTIAAASSHVGTGGIFVFCVSLFAQCVNLRNLRLKCVNLRNLRLKCVNLRNLRLECVNQGCKGSDAVGDSAVIGDGSDRSGLSALSTLSSLLLLKTAASASAHVGIGGSPIVVGDFWAVVGC